jgi:hypothetical protein
MSNTKERARLPVHDRKEFHGFQDGRQEILLAERVSDYTIDTLPKAFVLHDLGLYTVFTQDTNHPAIYYDRAGATPYILHIQLTPDYTPANTGIFYTQGTRQLVALLDYGQHDTLAFDYGDGVIEVEPDVALSPLYAKWLSNVHHNFGLDVRLPTALLKQAEHFSHEWSVFSQDQVV